MYLKSNGAKSNIERVNLAWMHMLRARGWIALLGAMQRHWVCTWTCMQVTTTTKNTRPVIRMHQMNLKLPNLPSSAARQSEKEWNAIGNHLNCLSICCTDMPSIENVTKTTGNNDKNVRSRQVELRTENSPATNEIELPKHSSSNHGSTPSRSWAPRVAHSG